MALLRKLNENGVEKLRVFLAEVKLKPTTPVPTDILTDLSTSLELATAINVESKRFGSRMAAAEYLHGLFSQAGASGLDRDPGVWAWLAMFYFDELCPLRKDGGRNPREIARWVPSGHAFRYYRHLLAGPYLIFKAFRDDPNKARIVLTGPLDTISDYTGQLAARQEFVQNKAVMEAATLLYFDKKTGKPKRGAAPTTHTPGTLRRFVDLINQLDPTWDLYSMNAQQLLAKLPAEFAAFSN
jgi:hypothetical protein